MNNDWVLVPGMNLLDTAVHELGHALGLNHSNIPASVMFPFVKGYNPSLSLHEDDIRGIQVQYVRCTKLTVCPHCFCSTWLNLGQRLLECDTVLQAWLSTFSRTITSSSTGTIQPVTQCHITEGIKPQQHHYEILKLGMVDCFVNVTLYITWNIEGLLELCDSDCFIMFHLMVSIV
jgi:Predicted Zn-dependent proteases